MLGTIVYLAACIVLPIVWGLITYGITRAIEKRRPPAATPPKKPAMPELEYYL